MRNRAALELLSAVVFVVSASGAHASGGEDSQQAAAPPAVGSTPAAEVPRIPDVLVIGKRTLNTDIQRTRDDAQPYVVFDRAMIRQSGATNVEDFLRRRLTMNTQASVTSQVGHPLGNISRINLRGLGDNQTLILVDGHRTSSIVFEGQPGQADINGIPISAVERIEVLPTTASGIYGGAATGGVVNIVLKRDYVGTSFDAKYDNTFDTDSAISQLGVTTAFDLEDGKTNVLLGADYTTNNSMLYGERDLFEQGRADILEHSPAFFLNASNPPLGATTNIRSVNGSPLFGPGTPAFATVPAGYAGGGGLAPLQPLAGQYNFDLADSSQIGGSQRGLLLKTANRSGLATVRREFGDSVSVFLEASGSRKDVELPTNGLSNSSYTIAANAPNNPFGQAVRVTVPIPALDCTNRSRTQEARLLGGVIVRLGGNWSAEADYNRSRFQTDYDVAPSLSGAESAAIANGSIDLLRDPRLYESAFRPFIVPKRASDPFRSSANETTLRAAGPVMEAWGGDIQLSASAAHRAETFDRTSVTLASGATTIFPSKRQGVDSVYLEGRLPFVSASNAFTGMKEFELQVAGRHDRYRTLGANMSVPAASAANVVREQNEVNSTNPTLAVRYAPIDGVTLRGSWGTGFLPPSVLQLVPNAPSSASFAVPDPRRGNQLLGTVAFIGGGNPDLVPEESASSSIGLIFEPAFLSGLRVSVDYARIEKTSNIGSPLSFVLTDFGSFEASFPERVTRAPPAPGDPFPVGRVTQLNLGLMNLARAEVEAYDFAVDYRFEHDSVGIFDFYGLATRQARFESQLSAVAPVVDNLSITSNSPTKLRANAGLAWSSGNLSLGWASRYVGSYRVSNTASIVAAQGNNGWIRPQTYHDVFGRFSYSGDSTVLSGLEVQVGIRNVLGESPPLDALDTSRLYSPHGDARLRTYYVSLNVEL